jgi:SAM-dependent methyltransferase
MTIGLTTMESRLAHPAHEPIPNVIDFVCNICGTPNRLAAQMFHRELANCVSCHANARFRGLMHLLSMGLFKKSLNMPDFPIDKSIKGIGFTDWEGYAARLAACFDYTNTHYTDEPRLDLTAREIPERYRDCDFVICSEVLEHVPLPIEVPFANLRSLLKPGGLLVFSVPSTDAAVTSEHYPDLYEFEVVSFKGTDVLLNRNKSGFLSVYDNLVFHGGGRTALEMRIYSEQQVLRHLRGAGFQSIEVHSRPILDIGYYWPPSPAPVGDHKSVLWRAYLFTAVAPER